MEDKWSLLYEYARKAFDDEVNRFARLDDKAVKFITATSIIITIFIALSKWLFSESNNCFTVYVYFISGLVFIFLCMAWFFYFLSLKLAIVPKIPMTDEVFELFKSKNISTVYVALYKVARTAVEEITITICKKSKYLAWGFKCTIFAGLLLILFISMVALESSNIHNVFCVAKLNTQHKEVNVMCKDNSTNANSSSNTNSGQPDNEPDLDVISPSLQYATEGLDSITDEKGKILNESTKKDEK